MSAAAHIGGGERPGQRQGGGSDSIARNLGRMCGHIAAAIRTPAGPAAAGGDVVARRIERCDAPGPAGTTLRRTVVDEIVAPAPATGNPSLRDHHAS